MLVGNAAMLYYLCAIVGNLGEKSVGFVYTWPRTTVLFVMGDGGFQRAWSPMSNIACVHPSVKVHLCL